MSVYVLCDKNCKYESMTKEQILAAIDQAVSTGKIQNVDTGFITKIKEQNANTALSFWIGTTAEYNAITEKVNNCFYILTDDTAGEDMEALFNGLNERLKALEEIHAKRGAVLFDGNYEQDVTTIKNIYYYYNVRVWVDDAGMYIPCTVQTDEESMTFKISGGMPVYIGTDVVNVSVYIAGNLYVNSETQTSGFSLDGVANALSAARWSVDGNGITSYEELYNDPLLPDRYIKIIGVM